MIIREYYTTRGDGVNLYRSYSDAGMMIRNDHTGAEYSKAVDVDGFGYTYTETTTPIDVTAPDNLAESAEYMLITRMANLPDPDPESDYFNELEPEPDYFA